MKEAVGNAIDMALNKMPYEERVRAEEALLRIQFHGYSIWKVVLGLMLVIIVFKFVMSMVIVSIATLILGLFTTWVVPMWLYWVLVALTFGMYSKKKG